MSLFFKRILFLGSLFVFCSLFVACGGGGSNDGDEIILAPTKDELTSLYTSIALGNGNNNITINQLEVNKVIIGDIEKTIPAGLKCSSVSLTQISGNNYNVKIDSEGSDDLKIDLKVTFYQKESNVCRANINSGTVTYLGESLGSHFIGGRINFLDI